MATRTRKLITIIAICQLAAAAAILALPRLVRDLPTRYKLVLSDNIQLMQPVLASVATPLPDAVPIPAGALARADEPISLPTLDFAPTPTSQPTATPPTPTPTPQPQQEASAPPAPEATMTPTATPTELPTPAPLPATHAIQNVQSARQNFNNCGPANLSIVLNYWGDATTQLEAASILKPNPEDRNVSPWQLSDYVNEYTGLRSTAHSGGTIETIKQFIANDIPVIIEKGSIPNENEGWLGHYYTVFAYDDEAQTFRSHDTYIGPFNGEGRLDSYQEIDFWWQQFNYTFFVIYRPEQEALVQNILGETLLEPTRMWENAALVAQQEIETDAENAFAWFNLGASLTRLGELTGNNDYYQQGASAFDQSFVLGVPPRIVWYQFRPYISYMKTERYEDMLQLADSTLESQGGRNVEETYLYRGHALAFLGETTQAIASYERGLELNRNSYPIQWALDSITK